MASSLMFSSVMWMTFSTRKREKTAPRTDSTAPVTTSMIRIVETARRISAMRPAPYICATMTPPPPPMPMEIASARKVSAKTPPTAASASWLT